MIRWIPYKTIFSQIIFGSFRSRTSDIDCCEFLSGKLIHWKTEYEGWNKFILIRYTLVSKCFNDEEETVTNVKIHHAHSWNSIRAGNSIYGRED